ncbi:MAG TPA: glutamate racemase [Armatimonadota bacterium]|nr:glutamate racemase [Armatimonadota bacterium]
MTNNPPIGIFDSGFGGLTVAKRVLERLRQESIVYVGDQAHVPYGDRSPEEIRSFALGITDFLIRRSAKLVIMACNMSSATALDGARVLFPDTPIIGVLEAGARAAARIASGGPIGVLATKGTVNTGAYTKALLRLLPEAVVLEQACPRFVPLVEAGMCDSPEAEEAAREYLKPLLAAGCRTLVLGCTHYPFLTDAISRVAGPETAIVDPAEETAAEAADILHEAGLADSVDAEPEHVYLTTGRPDQFSELGSRFLGRTIRGVRRIDWGLDLGAIQWQEKMAGQTTKSAL